MNKHPGPKLGVKGPRKSNDKSDKRKLPPTCGHCNKKFGLFTRRYQCGKCKSIVCSHCSAQKSRKEPRLCAKCQPLNAAVQKPAQVSAAPKPKQKEEWKCEACGFNNDPEHNACFACSTERQKAEAQKPRGKGVSSPAGPLLKWWCAVCTFENEEAAGPAEGVIGEHIIAHTAKNIRDKGVVKSINPDGTLNLLFDNLEISLHVPKAKVQKQAINAKCLVCNADKPAFSYPYWACPSCTLANVLSHATCELCQTAKPPAGPALIVAQEQAHDADVLLVRDTQPTPVKKPGDFTLLASDVAALQAQIEAVKKALADKAAAEAENKARNVEAPAQNVSESATTDAPASTDTATTAGADAGAGAGDAGAGDAGAAGADYSALTTIPTEESKKPKKSVRFGFSPEEPKHLQQASRLAYARAATLSNNRKKGAQPKKGGQFAITLRSEWLEAEMNVNKMMSDWDSLNRKSRAISEVDETKAEETKGGEAKAEEPKPEEPKPEEPKPEESKPEEPKPEESTTEESATEESATEESKTEEPKAEEESKAEESKIEESKTEESKTEESKTEEPQPEPEILHEEGEQQALFKELEASFKSISEEDKVKEKEEAAAADEAAAAEEQAAETKAETSASTPAPTPAPEPTPTPEPTPEPTPSPAEPAPTPTPTPAPTPAPAPAPDVPQLSLERELLAYLEGNLERMKAFAAHSQRYSEGKMTAFVYYYMIGKTFGDGLLPVVLPLLLQGLVGNPKRQEALRCYHLFAISKSCGRCGKIVYLPEEIRGADKSWHRWCFKCSAESCNITLDLRSFFAKDGRIYCAKHLPK